MLHEEEFLIRHASAGNDGDLFAFFARESGGDGVERGFPARDLVLAAGFHHRIGEAEFAVHEVEVETAAVAHPGGVHVVVVAWGLAVNRIATGTDFHATAATAASANAVCFREEPHALLEAEIGAGQSADGADIDGVERVIVLQTLAGMHGEGGVTATLGEAEHGFIGDLGGEADAAAAHDAALVIEAHTRADIDVLRLLDLVFAEAALAFAVLDTELLEAALACLIADGAIERVIDEEEFHHALAAFLREGAFGADAHAFGDGVRTGDDGARHPADLWHAVLVFFRLGAGSGARRHAHFDQAHAAVAGGGEFGVVAVVRDLGLGLLARFDHARAFGELEPDAVDLHVHEIGRWGRRGGRGGSFSGSGHERRGKRGGKARRLSEREGERQPDFVKSFTSEPRRGGESG